VKSIVKRVAAGLAFVATPLAIWTALTISSVRPFLPKCLLHETTGLYCPGCGGTRAVFALSKGHWAEAFHNNLFWPVTLPLLAFVWLNLGIYALKGKSLKVPYQNTRAAVAIAVLIILYGVVRNIPVYPFTLLAPLK